MLTVHRFVTGPIETNTWLVCNRENNCLIIDPSSGCEELLKKIAEEQLSPEAIVLTHSHFDHMLGVPEILRKFPTLPLYVHPADQPGLRRAELNGSILMGFSYTYDKTSLPLEPGRQKIGSFECEVFFVPGHTPGGCAIVIDNYCFCGDSLFAGSVGRSDLPGGNGRLLIDSIKAKLLPLPDDMIVCPGHGGRTSIGREKRTNPFLTE